MAVEERRDPWAGEKMSRSDAQRKYSNIIQYQLRPMLGNRSLSEDGRVQVLKRIIREAARTRYESGVVPGSGTREEMQDLLRDFFKPDHPAGEELKDWVKRALRAFGASFEAED